LVSFLVAFLPELSRGFESCLSFKDAGLASLLLLFEVFGESGYLSSPKIASIEQLGAFYMSKSARFFY
jgi:hypothetical protein